MADNKAFGNVFGEMLGRSSEIKESVRDRRIAELKEMAAIQEKTRAEEQADTPERYPIFVEHGKTVAFLSDLLNLANREKAWIAEAAVSSSDKKSGDAFLRLEDSVFEDEYLDSSHFLLPIPREKIQDMVDLFDLSQADREILLRVGFYPESSAMPDEDVVENDRRSGVTHQLYDLLGAGVYEANYVHRGRESEVEEDLALSGLDLKNKNKRHRQKIELLVIE